MPTTPGSFIPRFAFWNPSTWAIPELYWDTFSQEQRIHAICKQLGKVIAYSDMLGVNVDDISSRLKAIEDGQLDDLIIAEVEAWFEENEPEIIAAISALNDALPIADFDSSNTVKSAIDAVETEIDNLSDLLPADDFSAEHPIKETLTQLDSKIDDLEDYVTSMDNQSMKVTCMYFRNSSTLVECAGKNIVIDFGSAEDASKYAAAFMSHGITHIDYAICSHFHNDHFRGITGLLPYCDENTVFVRQMNCTDSNNSSYENYIDCVTQFNNAVTSLGATQIIPTNGQKIYLTDDEKAYLQFWNTNPTYEASYTLSWKEAGNQTPETQSASFNNYSLITRVQNGNTSFVDCGDVETVAQLNNANDMRKCTLAKIPHHNGNMMGYYRFFNALDCEYYFYNIYENELSEENYTATTFELAYMTRYARQVKPFKAYLNWKTECVFNLDNRTVNVEKGYYIDPLSGCENWALETNVRGVFPPALLHFDYPGTLKDQGITQLLAWADYMSWSKPIKAQANSSYLTSSPFMLDIKKALGYAEDNTTATFEIIPMGDFFEVHTILSTGRGKSAYIYSSFVRDDFPNTGCRVITQPTTRTPAIYTLPSPVGVSTTNLVSDSGVSANFFMNDKMIVTLDNNVQVPLERVSDDTFKGCVAGTIGTSATAPNFYMVNIAERQVKTCCAATQSGITQRQVKAIVNPYL